MTAVADCIVGVEEILQLIYPGTVRVLHREDRKSVGSGVGNGILYVAYADEVIQRAVESSVVAELHILVDVEIQLRTEIVLGKDVRALFDDTLLTVIST